MKLTRFEKHLSKTVLILAILCGLCGWPAAVRALPYFSGLYVSGTVDTSGNSRGASVAAGSYANVTYYPKPYYGSAWGHSGNTSSSITVPLSVIQTDMKTNTVMAMGTHFAMLNDDIAFSDTYALISATFNGKELTAYTDWNGGTGRRFLLKANGSFSYSNTAGIWGLDRPYGVMINVYPTHVDLLINDVAMRSVSKVASITTTMDMTNPSVVNIGSFNGGFPCPYYLNASWFSNTTFTADPLEGSTNWEPLTNWALLNDGDSSVQGFGCTPTATSVPGYYVGGYMWPMVALNMAPGAQNFFNVGWQYNPRTDSSVPSWAPSMNEGYSGEHSDTVPTHFAADNPHYDPFGSSGANTIQVIGGTHGDELVPYSSPTVQAYTAAYISAIHAAKPSAKIVVVSDYIIQSPPVGSIQNMGKLAAFNAVSSTGYVWYYDLASKTFTANTCGAPDNYTHPNKIGFYDLWAPDFYSFLQGVVATPTPTITPTSALTPTPSPTPTVTFTQTPACVNVGNQVTYTTDLPVAWKMFLKPVTVPSGDTFGTCMVYATAAQGKLSAGLYDASVSPPTLVAHTPLYNAAKGWNTIPLSTSSLTHSTYYLAVEGTAPIRVSSALTGADFYNVAQAPSWPYSVSPVAAQANYSLYGVFCHP